MVLPDTFNDDTHVINLFNFVMPETFKLLTLNVEGFVKLLIDVFILVIAVLLVFMYKGRTDRARDNGGHGDHVLSPMYTLPGNRIRGPAQARAANQAKALARASI